MVHLRHRKTPVQVVGPGKRDPHDGGSGATASWGPARRARVVLAGLIAALTALGWLYLASMVAAMLPRMDMSQAGFGMGVFNQFNLLADLSPEARAMLGVLCLPTEVASFGMPGLSWGAHGVLLVFLMWMMMTVAMMLPSAFPVLARFAARAGELHVVRDGKHAASTGFLVRVATFLVSGYLSVWTLYAGAATLVQWGLTELGMITWMMAPVSLVFSGTTLVAGGIYQFTPAKQACLLRCWYPRYHVAEDAEFSAASLWREGWIQGLACFGCCWALMTVMFSVGVMNILWTALLGILMTAEKNIPSRWFSKAIGVFFVLWGGALLAIATGVLPGNGAGI